MNLCSRAIHLTGAAWLLSGLAGGVAFAETDTETAAPAASQLPTVEVVGQAPQTYHSGQNASSKTTLSVHELPQSVQVITRQTIDDLGATRLDTVLDYVSGVTRGNSFGDQHDGVLIRGLPGGRLGFGGADALLNGFSTVRGYPIARDLSGVERVEFLKGPTAALYGSGSPGGLMNVVSKRPLWTPRYEASTRFGSYGLRRGAFDASSALGENVAYRLNAAAEEGGSFRDHVEPRRYALAPALTWRLGADTTLDYVGEIVQRKAQQDRGIPAVNRRMGVVPRHRFLGDPRAVLYAKNNTQQLILSHDWNPDWSGRLGASWRHTSLDGDTANIGTNVNDLQPDGTIAMRRNSINFRSNDLTLQGELYGGFQTAGLEHEVLLGVEGYRYELNSRIQEQHPDDAWFTNIHNPIYGQPQPRVVPNRDVKEHQRNVSFYAQDVIKLAQDWRLMLGVRHDRHEQTLFNRFTGVKRAPIKASATSPRLGLSWLASPQWTVYASASQSFVPNGGVSFEGHSFEPEKGRALESGVKWEHPANTLGLTLALFDIRKRNILTSDPNHPGYSINVGEVHSRGLEVDLSGRISAHWRAIASASRLDSTVSRDNNQAPGSGIPGAARVTASALLVHERALTGGQRYHLGAGIVYMGRRFGESLSRRQVNQGLSAFYLPAYTTMKLTAGWQASDALRFSLDVDNLLDRIYYTSSITPNWVAPGAARTVTASAQFTF